MNIYTAALIVVYNPNENILLRLIRTLVNQVSSIFIYCNSDMSKNIFNILKDIKNVSIINNNRNLGLGVALNDGIKHAIKEGYKYIVLFDQDSDINVNYINQVYEKHEILKKFYNTCIAIGPTYYDYRSKNKEFADYKLSTIKKCDKTSIIESNYNLVEVEHIITSGMMINVEHINRNTFFNEWLFVDHTDTEWCFRVRKQKYKIFVDPGIYMGHALSDSRPIKIGFFHLLRYSPIRRYYFYRSSVFLVCSSITPLKWKLKLLGNIIFKYFFNVFLDTKKVNSGYMMIKGTVDSLWYQHKKKTGIFGGNYVENRE